MAACRRGGAGERRQRAPPSSFRPARVTVSPASSASSARISSGPRARRHPARQKQRPAAGAEFARQGRRGRARSLRLLRSARDSKGLGGGPVQRLLGVGGIGCACASRSGSSQCVDREQGADAGAVVALVGVGWVIAGVSRPRRRSRPDRTAASRATGGSGTPFAAGARPAPREPTDARSAREAHQQGFGLVVEMMRSGEAVSPRSSAQSASADSGPRAPGPGGWRPARPSHGQDRVWHIQLGAECGNHSPPRLRFRHAGRDRRSRLRSAPDRAAAASSRSARLSGPPETAMPMRLPGATSASRSAAKRVTRVASGIIQVPLARSAAFGFGFGPREQPFQLCTH